MSQPPDADPALRRVRGTVSHVDGTAIGSVIVQAYSRQVGGETPLGVEVATDDSGRYLAGYVLPPGISSVDLYVRAYDDEHGQIGTSPIIIGARPTEVIDLEVSDPRFRGPSEFAVATDALGPRVAASSGLAQLTADDVALLVRTTGVGRVSATAWIAAARLAERTKLDAESLYGLIRGERTASLPKLLRRHPTRLIRTLKAASADNVISLDAGRRAEQTVARLRQLAAEVSASSETPRSLGVLLNTCKTATAAQRTAFLQRYAAHDGPVSELWAQLRADPGFGGPVVADLQLTLQLGAITANHAPLVGALRARGINHIAGTAQLSRQDWLGLVESRSGNSLVGIPPTIRGATKQEQMERYVELLLDRTARAVPTAYAAKALKRLPDWSGSTSVAFLDRNPDLNLLTADLRSTLDAPGTALEPDWDRNTLTRELKTVQRAMRVAPRGKEEGVVQTLLGNGYSSAFSIARQSRTTFTNRTASAFGDAVTAAAVHSNAQFMVARSGSAYAMLHPQIGAGLVASIGNPSTTVTEDPTWASLFGDVDYCACDHCGSIFGPAAYLADLLAWLDGHDAGPKTAFERLDDRRPDLQRIELSCDNVNIVLPYVDLLNEILEVKVLNPSGRTVGLQVPTTTTGTSPELLANPEHGHPAAYNHHLAEAVFPFNLPFDLWAELGRVYFTHLGVRRSDLMEALQRRRTPRRGPSDRGLAERSTVDPATIDAERLGLTTTQWGLVAGTSAHELWELWGYAEERPDGKDYKLDLAVVSTFTDRAQLTYSDLLDLLHGRFVNPGGIGITGPADDTDAMRIASLPDDLLQRMQAFLRLWRNRGWSLLDLDKALQALAPDGLDEAALSRFADLDRVQGLTGAPLLDVLSWWSPIDTLPDRPEKDEPVKSLYARIFANRAVDPAAEDPDFALALNPAGTELANPPLWEDVRALLEASLVVDADELATLLDETVNELPNPYRVVSGDTASLGGLSALYRHVSFARALDLRVTELVAFLPMVGIEAFDIGATGATVEAIETLADIRASGFSLLELHYLLEHEPVAETSVGVTDEAIGQTLVEIRDGLIRVAADQAVAADPAVAEAATQALIIEKVAAFAGRDLDCTQDLLALRLPMTVDGTSHPALEALRRSPYVSTTAGELTVADDPEAFAALRRAYKVGVVLKLLNIGIDAQLWLFETGVRNGLLNPVELPITPQPLPPAAWLAWIRLVDLAALETDLPGGEPTLIELLTELDSADQASAEETFRTDLATRTGWLREDLDSLIEVFDPTFPDEWRDGQLLRDLVDAFALVGRLAVSAARANAWASNEVDEDAADELRLAAKAKHDEERWPDIARALRDPVRELQRAALVAHLIARDDSYADENALYDDLLIDVEMEPCMLTSRIKQAISTVQLFIERAFLNLEDGVEFTRDDRDQWVWMKNYRVWEAARKVFLYPETWIEPELRLDKTPLFTQLEQTLMQGELGDVTADKAYATYLEGLLAISRLEVMGLYHQYESDDDGTIDILHVVARTRSNPYAYYYRQRVDSREWTPWEPIDAEIDAEHIVLAVTDRRLLVLWPSVVQKSEPIMSSDPEVPPTQHDYYEMKLAFLERMNDQWGSRQLSTGFLTVDEVWERTESAIYFRLRQTATLIIECLQRTGDSSTLRGTFTVDAATGEVLATNLSSPRTDEVPVGEAGSRMRFATMYVGVEVVDTGEIYTSPVSIVSATRDADGEIISGPDDNVLLTPIATGSVEMSYAYPHQYGDFTSQHGVFFDDEDRTYHVLPESVVDYGGMASSDGVSPSDVGATEAGSDTFTPPESDPPYEPDLPWDKTHQEPPILAQTGVARRAAGSDRGDGPVDPPVAMARLQATATPGPGAGLLDEATISATLTQAELAQSQHQLFEVEQSDDAMTFPHSTKYRFSLFCHPFVTDFMTALRRSGVAGLLDPNPDGPTPRLVRQQLTRTEFFTNTYVPTFDVLQPYPTQDVDFNIGGPYAIYNWELFFHAPLLIAGRLSANQRFDEARRWYHYVFDPTNRSDEDDPLRFWKIKPFYHDPDEPIEKFLALAAADDNSPEAIAARDAYDQQIQAWQADPFNPGGIADVRTTAYQKTLVMKYLDNLLAWGDQLFRADTIESINEATMLYVLALQLLGDPPESLPPREPPVATTFEQVRTALADSVLSNPLVELENVLPASRMAPSLNLPAELTVASSWTGLLFPRPPAPETSEPARGFYFCIPPNENLLAYWGTVEDRLFKIRHCMNIEGVVRQLPLFEPPIDPALLVRARAAGVDLTSALTDLSAPLPHYRFSAMLQKAYTLNQTVRGLGAALLSALEKNDAEALSMLRANQELAVLSAVRQAKELAVDEARNTLTAAELSLAAVQQRRDYYQGLIIVGLRPEEGLQSVLMETARKKQRSGSTAMAIAGGLASIPTIVTGASGVAASPVATSTVVVGLALAKVAELGGQKLVIDAASLNADASSAGITAGYVRRAQEWNHQHQLALREYDQISAQIEAARVRLAMAERELANHDLQIENSRSVRAFLEQKFTSVELYQWMVGQVSSLYFASYQLAYDLAKQTERAYQTELALPAATFIQFGYWDSLKKGMLAGERLQYDLERMDAGYLAANAREYELTKHVSLALLDPVALLQLQTAGSCEFTIPEAFFDFDYPGHYLRRIKSVSVTVPCVAGPFTGVPMRLTLVSSVTRTDPSATGDYPMDPSGSDTRFQQQVGAVQSVSFSSGREDSGLFTPDYRDERYLPYEGSGAISNWSLQLTSAVPTFAWTTITDVVLHVRYVAREGGELLKAAALRSLESELAGLPLRRAFSARTESPSEWSTFLHPAGDAESVLSLELSEQVFGYIAQNAGLEITNLEVVVLAKDPAGWTSTEIDIVTGSSSKAATVATSPVLYGGQPAASVSYSGGVPPGRWQLSFPLDQLGPPLGWADDIVWIATYEIRLGSLA